jgi:acetyltransferase-like isoleucine patch superfamily enzyme
MVKPESRVMRQVKVLVIWAFNVVYNAMPFFALKNILLRLTGIRIGMHTVVHTPVRFLGMGRITLGSNSIINARCYLDNRVGITIGDSVSIAHDTKIYTLGHDIDDPYFSEKGARVEIGDYVCIFSNVLIMPGVKLGKGAVVYSGSVVTKDVDDYAVVGGNPARFIRYRSKDLRYKVTYDYWFAF